MEENVLIVIGPSGNKIKLNVIDIVYVEEFKKEYIIYAIENDAENNVYASILNEDEKSYQIKTIENDDEWNFIQGIIDEMSTNVEGV